MATPQLQTNDPSNTLLNLANTLATAAPVVRPSVTTETTSPGAAYNAQNLINILTGKATNASQYQDIINNILNQSAISFAPVRGEEVGSGGYNSTTLKMLQDNARALATSQAAQKVIEAQQNAAQTAAQLTAAQMSANRTATKQPQLQIGDILKTVGLMFAGNKALKGAIDVAKPYGDKALTALKGLFGPSAAERSAASDAGMLPPPIASTPASGADAAAGLSGTGDFSALESGGTVGGISGGQTVAGEFPFLSGDSIYNTFGEVTNSSIMGNSGFLPTVTDSGVGGGFGSYADLGISPSTTGAVALDAGTADTLSAGSSAIGGFGDAGLAATQAGTTVATDTGTAAGTDLAGGLTGSAAFIPAAGATAAGLDLTQGDVGTNLAVDALTGTTGLSGAVSAASNVSVLCTELNRQGIIDTKTYRQGAIWARKNLSLTTMKGYWLWGKPLARQMRKGNKLALKLASFLAINRAAYLANSFNITGFFIHYICTPICYILGLLVVAMETLGRKGVETHGWR